MVLVHLALRPGIARSPPHRPQRVRHFASPAPGAARAGRAGGDAAARTGCRDPLGIVGGRGGPPEGLGRPLHNATDNATDERHWLIWCRLSTEFPSDGSART